MNVKHIAAGLGLALAAPAAAHAQPPRTVAYFIMHTPERQAVEQGCYGGRSPRFAATECVNAHQASFRVLQAENKRRAQRGRTGMGSVDSPLYWDNNPVARYVTLQQCAHPTLALGPDATECEAARISAGR